MTETTAKRRPGRPRKLPQTDAAPPPPVAVADAPAGLSAAPMAVVAEPMPPPVQAVQAAPVEALREDPRSTDVRDSLRAEDPRAEADRIAAEWFGHLDSLGPQKDKYYVDPTKIPDGWSYEWRTYTVVGKENPQYMVQLQRAGWRPVPSKRHPELMPKNWTEGTILIDGMMLMERPKAITDFQKVRDKREAEAPIENIRAKLTGAPQGHFPRGVGGAPAAVNTAFAPPDIAAKTA
jgi:hypothetical protein